MFIGENMYNAMFIPGDFGGYLGLLVGASVITVFELLDLIVYNGVVKCSKRFSPSKVQGHSKSYDVQL